MANLIGNIFSAETARIVVATRRNNDEYEHKLIKECGNEFGILLDKPIEEIRACGGEMVAEAIDRMRKGNIYIKHGYDGEFGVIKIFNPDEREKMSQTNLL